MAAKTEKKSKDKKQKKKADDITEKADKPSSGSWTIWDRRNYELKNLKSKIKSLKKSISYLERKIDAQGLDGYYSQNHDCMRYSEAVWRSCLRLALLKKLDEEINNE